MAKANIAPDCALCFSVSAVSHSLALRHLVHYSVMRLRDYCCDGLEAPPVASPGTP